MNSVALWCLLLGAFVWVCDAQKVTGCPGYGCSPRGTFSYEVKVPNATDNGRIAWVYDGFIGPLPKALGCVGNPTNIVCQSNGPRYDGYISLDVYKGVLMWTDPYTRFPVLPVMDVYGDIIGSDGHQLIRIDTDGKLYTPIQFEGPISPVYSLIPSFNGIIIIVSQQGLIFGYDAAGVPFASIFLNSTIERTNGTFLPIAQPIIAENRIFLLTEFRADFGQESTDPSILGLQRLYAIDVFTRMADRLHISWYYNFETESDTLRPDGRKNKPETHRHPRGSRNVVEMTMESDFSKPVREPINENPSVLYDASTKTVFVNLPEPYFSSNTPRTLWALRDGDTPSLLYKAAMNIHQMAICDSDNYTSSASEHIPKNGGFESAYYDDVTDKTAKSINYDKEQQTVAKDLWVLLKDKKTIVQMSTSNGNVLKTNDVNTLISTSGAIVTSDVMVTRSSADAEDILVFGVAINFTAQTPQFDEVRKRHSIEEGATSYILGVQGSKWELIWIYGTPENLPVVGQIAGIPLSSEINDILVAFAGNSTVSKIFALTSK